MQNSYTVSSKKYIFFILILIVTFCLCTELFIRKYITPIPKSIPHLLHLVYTENNPNIVIGDSHIYRGFLTEKEFLNLGRKGMPIPVMKIILDNYFSKTKPNKVILEASPQLFSEVHQQRYNLGFDNYLILVNSLTPLYLLDPGFTQYFININNLKSLRKVLNKEWNNDLLKGNNKWLKLDQLEKQRRELSRVNHHRPIMNSDIATEFKLLYEQVISDLILQGAEVCLIRTPVNSGYEKLTRNDPAYIEANEFFIRLSEKYHINFIDYKNLGIYFSEDKFINQDHITPKASKEYSPAIKSFCFNN